MDILCIYIYIYDYHKWIAYQLVEGLAGFLNHRGEYRIPCHWAAKFISALIILFRIFFRKSFTNLLTLLSFDIGGKVIWWR